MPAYFLCGVGGSGMSALARLLMSRGCAVAGSDRSRDRGETPEKFAALAASGITLFPQDGSGLTATTDALIVSSAVEDSIPDVQAARLLNLPIRKRADLLAEMFNAAPQPIGIAGTSGKSTTTAMAGWILQAADRAPTVVNGAAMANFSGSPNAVAGSGTAFVAELDESDGSIALFRPRIAVLNNVTLDHKPLAELRVLFGDYLRGAATAIVNADDMEAMALAPPDAVTFALERAADLTARDIQPQPDGSVFTVHGEGQVTEVRLHVPGRHNVANALAALLAARAAGVSIAQGVQALADYRGIGRRFQWVGTANGITVIDDFAHNPDKIAATLRTLHEQPGRVVAIFQPHGFGPTRLMRAALIAMFVAELGTDDRLVMPEIYYAGGTAARDISSADIIDAVAKAGRHADFVAQRRDIPAFVAARAQPGDRIVVMGARDDTLPAFAADILQNLPRK